MKRSFINKIVNEAIEFSKAQHLTLPKFAYITADDWKKQDHPMCL